MQIAVCLCLFALIVVTTKATVHYKLKSEVSVKVNNVMGLV